MSNESEGTPNPLNPGVGSIPSSNNNSPEPLAPVFDEQRISKIRESVTTITLDSPIGLTTPSEPPKPQVEPAKSPAKMARSQAGPAGHHHSKRAMDFVRPSKKVDSGRMDVVNSPRPHHPGMTERREHHHPMRETDDYYNGEDFKGFREPKEIDDLAPAEEREIVSPPLNDEPAVRRTASKITIDEIEESPATEPGPVPEPERESEGEPEEKPESEQRNEFKEEPKDKSKDEPKEESKEEPVPKDTGDFVPVSDFSANKPGQGQMPPSQQLGVVTNLDGTVPTQNLSNPMKRPMEQAPLPEAPKPKKKHTGLIVGMIISIFLAVGCGVAAVLVMLNNKPDPVAEAFNRVVDGKSPKNIEFEGTAQIAIDDKSLPVSEMTINIDGVGEVSSLLNSTTASLSAKMRNGGTFALEMGEVYAANGDLYLMMKGANNVLNDPYLLPSLANPSATCEGQENCPEEAKVAETSPATPADEARLKEVRPGANPDEAKLKETNPTLSSPEVASAENSNSILQVLIKTLQAMQTVDGEWVRMSVDETNKVLPEELTEEQTVKCLSGFVNDLRGNSNSITKLYKENPFIVASKQASQVKSEQNPIYRVVVEDERFSNFMYAAKDQTVVKNLMSCLGYTDKVLNVEKILKDMQSWPEIYTEIDENYNFTRLYMASNLKSSDYCETGKACTDRNIGTAILDLDFSYPATIDVSEPTSYRNASEL